MKVLVVEDDAEKRRHIALALGGVGGIDLSADVRYVGDVESAQRELRERYFDLVVLDIVLPVRMERPAEQDAGLRLLDELLERPGYHVPGHVVGLTAHDDVVSAGAQRFEQRLLTLLLYDAGSTEWSEKLQARARHILLAATSAQSEPSGYRTKVAIICALEVPELRHVLHLPWSWEQISLPGDHTIYYRGRVGCADGEHPVVAAAVARMGMPAAATLAMKMILAFRPQYIAMAGIAAGVRGRTNLGDVLVADPSWDWGSGKRVSDGAEVTFQPAPHQLPLATDLRYKARRLAGDAGILNGVREGWDADRPESALSVRLGPLASGAAVLADGKTIAFVLEQHRQLLGIDMEAYGVFAAAAEAPEPQPKALAMKAVVDFADGSKDDRFQNYAAYASAQLLRHLTERFL